MERISTSKAEIARKLNVSPAYVTLLCQGKRRITKKLQRRINKLKLTNEFNCLTFNQVVLGSSPRRLRFDSLRIANGIANILQSLRKGIGDTIRGYRLSLITPIK